MDELEALEGRSYIVFQVGITPRERVDLGRGAMLGKRQVGFDRLPHALVGIAGVKGQIIIRARFIHPLNHR